MRQTPPRSLLPLLAIAALAACDPYDSYCGRVEQCAKDEEDGFENIDVEDDYRSTCAAQLRAGERVLRSNEEEECQVVADGYRAYMGCLAGLDCEELNDEVGNPDKCEDQRDDYNEAIEDADGECQGFSIAGCSAAPGTALFAFLALLATRRRRRR